MAQVAEHTRRIQLGTAVLIPSLRHVVTQAAAIATIEDIAPGRLTVGFATGFTGRHALGQKRRLPWTYVKRYVQQLRGLLHGDTVEVDGALCRLMPSAGYMPPFPIEVPIFLAASGPRGRQVAKEVADGVIMPSLFVTGGFDTCVVTVHGTVLDEAEDVDSSRVRAAAGAGVALVYHTTYEARGEAVDALPNGRAWRESIERIPEETRHLALHVGHGIEMNEHDRAHIPITAAKRLTFTGTPSELRARLTDLEARGATEIVFGVRGPDMPRELRAFAALMQES
jgi:5,10-methylenetetrahydromethanopterin reductase